MTYYIVGSVAVLFVCVAFWYFNRVHLVSTLMEKHHYFQNAPRQIFISYKSKNSTEACALAESLMLLGYRVWIDQYRIPLFEDTQFEDYLDKGMEQCGKAILMTNQLYSDSYWCRYEINKILKNYGKRNVCQIHIPNDTNIYDILSKEILPLYKEVPAIDWPNSATKTVRYLSDKGFIKYVGTFPSLPVIPPAQNVSKLLIKEAGIFFNTSSWTKLDLSNQDAASNEFDRHGYMLKINKVKVMLHILVQDAGKTSRPQKVTEKDYDDRTVFLENREVAKQHIVNMQQIGFNFDLVGSHLVEILGFSHLAITYFMWNESVLTPPCYMRKYVLTFPGKSVPNDVDIIITARVIDPKQRDIHSLFKHSPLLNQFITSAHWS